MPERHPQRRRPRSPGSRHPMTPANSTAKPSKASAWPYSEVCIPTGAERHVECNDPRVWDRHQSRGWSHSTPGCGLVDGKGGRPLHVHLAAAEQPWSRHADESVEVANVKDPVGLLT